MTRETPHYELVCKIAECLCQHKLKLVVAESCTGGWLAKVCTDVAGSSEWFAGGLVTYSNEMKATLLDIEPQLLETQGAVSQAVVVAMVTQVLLKVPAADIAIAVSGIAGPSGASPEKPLGTVWIAWQRRHQSALANHFRFSGDRAAIRAAAVKQALEGLAHLIPLS